MEKIKALLKSIRWINLFIIALTQYLVRYCIIIPLNKSTVLSDFDFFLLVLSTILIAAAGYIINDYFDTKVDRLNNRTVVVGTIIKRREAIITHFFWTSNTFFGRPSIFFGCPKHTFWTSAKFQDGVNCD